MSEQLEITCMWPYTCVPTQNLTGKFHVWETHVLVDMWPFLETAYIYIPIYDYTQNLCACDKYIPTSDHTKKLHVPIHVCAHTEDEHAQKQHVFEHVWTWQHVTMLWNCMCVNMWVHAKIYVHSWKFHVIMCVYAKISPCLKIVCIWKCVHIYTHKHTLTWLYLENVCV